jgi:hypothetical protein
MTMKSGLIRIVLPILTLVLTGFVSQNARAEEPKETSASVEPETELEPESTRKLLWSTTLFGQFKAIHSPQNDRALGGFFDQYEFTPNKNGDFPVELGVRDASFDLIEDREPLLQFRYESPTSNLGTSGSDLDGSFTNQRALLLGRRGPFQLDIDYRRMRTEQRRVYPDTEAGGGALPFTDLTRGNDRFFRDRTGFQAELRWHAAQSFGEQSEVVNWLAPELSLRGGYDERDAKRQLRMSLNPGNDWLAIQQNQGDEVGDVGVGLVVAPGGRFTMVTDFDYQEFSANNARLDDSLPFASTSRSVGFVPSSERKTGKVRLHYRFGDRAVLTGGFQGTLLEQEDPDTPAQRSVGFGKNKTIVYSAQLAGDFQVVQDVSTNVNFKVVYRDHDIDQSTSLFNPSNGTQVDEFLDSYSRIDVGAETIYRPNRVVKLAFGANLLWIDRDLDFAPSGLGNRVILPENALANDETLMWTVFGRAEWRPSRSLGIRTKLSFRDAPETGYLTDLDGYVEGSLRATYTLPVTRPTTLSFYVRGGTGENSDLDFAMVDGLGPNPPGPSVERDYERAHWTLGLTGDLVLRDDLTLFGSFFYSQDQQSDDLLLSNAQRYFQDSVPLSFRKPGSLDFQSDEYGIVFGSQIQFSAQTDAGLSYSFTRAEANYDDSGSARELQLIDDNRVVDADIHGLDFEIRHQLRAGLRAFAGYRLQHYRDGASKPSSPSSSQQPQSRKDTRHTFTLGITLNSELLSSRR